MVNMALEDFKSSSEDVESRNMMVRHAAKISKQRLSMLKAYEDVDDEDECFACNDSGELIEHHLSYRPEVTITVCTECHGKIHSDSSELEKLEPINRRPKKAKIPNVLVARAEHTPEGEDYPLYKLTGCTSMQMFVNMAVREKIKELEAEYDSDSVKALRGRKI